MFELLPFLKYVPFMPGKQNARQIGVTLYVMYTDLFGRLKWYLSQAQSSVIDVKYWGLIGNIIRDQEREKESEKNNKSHFTDSQLKTMAQFVQDAATDTTLSTAMTCIMALTANSHLLRKVQEEVETVCGRGNVPSHLHVDKLPYVKACVLEVCSSHHIQCKAPLTCCSHVHTNVMQGTSVEAPSACPATASP